MTFGDWVHHRNAGCCRKTTMWVEFQSTDRSRGTCSGTGVLRDAPGSSPLDPRKNVGQYLLTGIVAVYSVRC